MKRLWIATAACTVIAIAVVAGCSKQPPPTPASTTASASDQAAFLEITKQLGKAMGQRDADGVESFFAADGWLVPPNSPILKTAAERRSYFAQLADLPPATDTVGDTYKLEMSSTGDLAVKMGSFVQVSTDGKGANLSTVKYNYIATWKRQPDNSWKVVSLIWSTGG